MERNVLQVGDKVVLQGFENWFGNCSSDYVGIVTGIYDDGKCEIEWIFPGDESNSDLNDSFMFYNVHCPEHLDRHRSS